MAILKFRKGNYISLKGSRAQETAVNVPDDLFMKCPACGETLYGRHVVGACVLLRQMRQIFSAGSQKPSADGAG